MDMFVLGILWLIFWVCVIGLIFGAITLWEQAGIKRDGKIQRDRLPRQSQKEMARRARQYPGGLN